MSLEKYNIYIIETALIYKSVLFNEANNHAKNCFCGIQLQVHTFFLLHVHNIDGLKNI